MSSSTSNFSTVYGPVTSWRYGKSLGIDPIGATSVCSFNCVYCQLGEIERQQAERALFIPTAQILAELVNFAPWEGEVITLSGSGEPTLALNLGEILREIKQLTQKTTLVLTNGTLLGDAQVRQELALADKVAIKLDALDGEQLRRINRPVLAQDLTSLWGGIEQFCQTYGGELAIQTMVLTPWEQEQQQQYLGLLRRLQPQEVQLNTPSRPKPLQRQLEGRGNHAPEPEHPYEVQWLKCVDKQVLQDLAAKIHQETGIRVRWQT